MPPVSYVNMYIGALLISFGASLFGIYYFYNGMGQVSFVVSDTLGQMTYFLDKTRYDMYRSGLIYCTTFSIASGLFLSVIVIPSLNQIQLRMAMPYGGAPVLHQMPQQMVPQMPQQMAPQMPQQMAPQPSAAPPPMQSVQKPEPEIEKKKLSPVLLDTIEGVDDFEEESRIDDTTGDADVVYGTAPITEDSLVEFIHNHPDSAMKFLYNKTLDGKPLSQKEVEIYQGWQKRGMSRGKVRDYILGIMEWEKLPSEPIHEIWAQLRDQIFELSH